MRLAILDDYAHLARRLVDWSRVEGRCSIDVFDHPIAPEDQARVLAPFDILCHLRERMAMPAALINQLPNLKFISVTGREHRTLDLAAATRRGIVVSTAPSRGDGRYSTPELAWGLILCAARCISYEDRQMRGGGWQHTAGMALCDKTLGLLGLGLTGRRMVEYGKAFGMKVIAWSQNLTAEAAAAVGRHPRREKRIIREERRALHSRRVERADAESHRRRRTRFDETHGGPGQYVARADHQRSRSRRGSYQR